MCYDIQSSLIAWFISNSIALYLYHRNVRYDRWNAAFIFVFSMVQMMEAGLWWIQKEGLPSKTNEILTKCILLILLLQPLTQSYFGWKYTSSELLECMTYIYTGMLLWGFFRIAKAPEGSFYTKPNAKAHLVWYDSTKKSFLGGNMGYIIPTLYLAGMFIPLLFQKENRGIPLLITGMLSFFFSWFIGDSESFSSLWCFYAVIYSIVALKS